MSHADIVVGLSYGDEGKGATVDFLNPDKVVRFNGGPQAAHNVIANGFHHTFSSLGSGTMQGAPTYIAGTCAIEPNALLNEMHEMSQFEPEVFIHEEALVTTSFHILANLVRNEQNNHGTTGWGFGETIDFSLRSPHAAIRAADLNKPNVLLDKLHLLINFYHHEGIIARRPEYRYLDNLANFISDQAKQMTIISNDEFLTALSDGYIVFEGAQGFMLDEIHGFNPHTTWSDTTPGNARKIINQLGLTDIRTIGCMRTYATRHGNGPMPGEFPYMNIPENHNLDDGIQGKFRVGYHDEEQLGRAISVVKPDILSVSHYDIFSQIQGAQPNVPIGIKANGPNREDRSFVPDVTI